MPRDDYLSRLNERLMGRIQADGRAFVSNALLDGRWALRACIVNWTTRWEDVEVLLRAVDQAGDRLSG